MDCKYLLYCGGCPHRNLSEKAYRELKINHFNQALQHLKGQNYQVNPPVFIADGLRRRAALTFRYEKKKLLLGFNENSSHNITDIDFCCALTSELNRILLPLKSMLSDLCAQPYSFKQGKKISTKYLTQGDVLICAADNGLDIVLEYDAPLDVNVRMIFAEFCQNNDDVIRLSHRRNISDSAETLVQKIAPVVKMGKYSVPIPAGTFLQASSSGEQALADLVVKSLQGAKGKVADLFCGVGTFSYYLNSHLNDIKILAIDSGAELLEGFKNSLNANQIGNIEIKKQNLFKYPLLAEEIAKFDAIVFDPPRSGAKEQCKQIALASPKPQTIVAVSCNPLTFINDANILIEAGYNLCEITLVDQFVYSNHSELVALFKLL